MVLQGPPSDYIHANYVEFKGTNKFICTQGPIDKTINDFWRMVLQERCQAIVMLCELVEMGKSKCADYYPVEAGSTKEILGGIIVSNQCVIPIDNMMTQSKLVVSWGDKKIEVKHYKWNNWPDRGVPDNKMAPFRLITRLQKNCPVIIHCSAGSFVRQIIFFKLIFFSIQALVEPAPLSVSTWLWKH